MSAVQLRRCELRDGAFQVSAGRSFNISPGDAPLSLGRRDFPPLDSRVSTHSVNLTHGVDPAGALVVTVENIGRHAVFISDIRYSQGGINVTAIVPRGTTGILRLGRLLHLLPDAHYLYADGDGPSQCITASDVKVITYSPTVMPHPAATDALSLPSPELMAPPSLPRDAPTAEQPPSSPLLQHVAPRYHASMQGTELGLDDTLSAFGKDPATPEVACPWSTEEISTKAGHLLRRFPWLQLNVPELSSMADVNPTALLHTQPPLLFSMGMAAGHNLNAHLTAHLVPLLDIYPVVLIEDEGVLDYKVKQIEEVVGALEHLPFRVESVDQLNNVPFLCGESTLKKIGEILTTKRLGLTEEYLKRPDVLSKMELTKIIWVKGRTAERLYSMGFSSVASLRGLEAQNRARLSHQQRVGVALYDDLNERIPREESEEMERLVRRETEAICPGSLCALGGSYRRGQPTSGDWDFILSPPPGKGPVDLLPKLYRRLRALGVITADLVISWGYSAAWNEPKDDPRVGADSARNSDAETLVATAAHADRGAKYATVRLQKKRRRRDSSTTSASEDESPESCRRLSSAASGSVGRGFFSWERCHTFMGVAVLPGCPRAVHRRIDLKCFWRHELPFALLAWTGNTMLSRSLKRYCSALGYHLEETALTPENPVKRVRTGKSSHAAAASGRSHNRVPRDLIVPCTCERDVFSFLGLRFIPPKARAVLCRLPAPETPAGSACGGGGGMVDAGRAAAVV